MRCKIGDTAHGVALNFNVGAEHLPDERFETAEFDYEQLVVRCIALVEWTQQRAQNDATTYC